MKPFRMALPRTINEAVRVSEDDFRRSKLLAGGTDLVAELKERTQTADLVVNLKHIPGLDQVERSEAGLEIGALVTLADLAASEAVRRDWPALAATVEKAATPAVRNVGTLGGNLCQRPRCWYYRDETYPCLKKGGWKCYAQEGENEFHAIYDNYLCAAIHPSNTAPVLMVHDAEVDIVGPEGARTVKLEDFFVSPRFDVQAENILEPREILVKVRLPELSKGSAAYVETREKQSFDWSTCGATVRVVMKGDQVEDARVVLSAVAPTPVRRPGLETMLRGQEIAGGKVSDELLERLADAAVVGSRPLAQNRYKVALVRATLARAVRQAVEGAMK